MPITLDCTCGRKLIVGDEHAGGQGQCPACGRLLDIPDPNAPPHWLGQPARAAATPLPPQEREATGPAPAWPPGAEMPPLTPPRRGVGLVVVAALLIAAVVYGVIRFGGGFQGRGLGEKLAVTANEEVYYKGVTADEARQLGAALKELGYFNNTSPKSVQLSRNNGRYAIAFVLKPGTWHNPDAVDVLWLISLKASARAFGGQPVEVRLCDMYMNEQKTLKPGDADLGAWLAVSPREDVYYRGITDAEARRLGDHLKQLREFDGNADRTLFVARDAAGVKFTIGVAEGDWNNRDAVDGLRLVSLQLAARMSDSQAVEVRLCDGEMNVKKSLKLDDEILGKWLAVSPCEDVYYRNVPEAQARKLGEFLQRTQYFTGKIPGVLVTMARDGEQVRLTFIVQEGAWDNAEEVRVFERYARQLRAEVFGIEAIEVRLADSYLRVKTTLPIR